jgi:2-oxoacid:acceptor oxidoreductase delta subunit (pyruvate/2-ketoisovalerate family)
MAVAKPIEIKSWRDIAPLHVSLGNVRHNHTGTWRFIKPIFEEKTPPCQNLCPSGNDIEGWIGRLNRGDHAGAYWHLKREQPFPAILGRVCFKFCQHACNRRDFDHGIGINELERFVGDQVPVQQPPDDLPVFHGRSVAVVGSGPAGMSCAYFARRMGFRVAVFEQESEPGGILRTGIPAFRLPRKRVAEEFEGLKNMGIALHLGVRVGRDLPFETLRNSFDFIFLAVGLHAPRKLELDVEDDTPRLMDGLDFLKRIALDRPVDIGQRVVVVGGGNTAVDAARSVVRLGAKVTVLYRRTAEEMPAHVVEVEQARQEGVKFRFLATPSRISTDRETGQPILWCRPMALGPAGADGRRGVIESSEEEFILAADTVIAAIGETADAHNLINHFGAKNGNLSTADDLTLIDQAPHGAHIYAGGDITSAAHTVVHAVAEGKRAAIAMDCRRRGLEFAAVREKIAVGDGAALSFSRYMAWPEEKRAARNPRRVVSTQEIVFDYFRKSDAAPIDLLPAETRARSFAPFQETFTQEKAHSEAARCLHCGRCTGCDNCLVFCPDLSVRPSANGSGYGIDYDYCKGCGICAAECPRHAITMIGEERAPNEEV